MFSDPVVRSGTGPYAGATALWVIAAALLIVLSGPSLPVSARGSPSPSSAPAGGATSPSPGPLAAADGGHAPRSFGPDSPTVALDLLNGSSVVSSQLVVNGYFNDVNTSFPDLLTGASTSQFWSRSQSVMVVAPALSNGHDSGLLLVPSSSGASVTVNAVGAFSPTISGDGLEAYLLLSPTSTANWSSAIFATDPEGSGGTFPGCAGSVIFPYSTTPYLVLQWEPAYTVARCASSTGQFNLYLVSPGASGVVTKSDITYIEAVGNWSGAEPSTNDFLALSATYVRGNDSVSASVVDENDSAVRYALSTGLAAYDFDPGAPGNATYYDGAGGSGNRPAGWGLLYLAASNGSVVATPPPAAPSISSVAFSGSPGNYTLAIDGSGFGPAPLALPTYGTTGYLRIGDDAQLGHGEWGYGGDANALEYDSWNSSQVVVSRFGGEPLDALQIALWNPTTGLGAAWGGNVPTANLSDYPSWYPEIDSVQVSGGGASTSITIAGTGFGTAPVSLPYTGDLTFLGLTDWREHCGGGSSEFQAGLSPWGTGSPDAVTLTYSTWTPTEIQISGFAGSYGSGCAVALTGDPVTVALWSTNASSDAGPQTAWGGTVQLASTPVTTNRSSSISSSLFWTGAIAPAGASLLVPGGNGLLELSGAGGSNVSVLDGGADGYWSFALPYGADDLLGGTDYGCPGGVRLDLFDPVNGSLSSLAGELPAAWTAAGHCRDLTAMAAGGNYTLLVQETNVSYFPEVGLLNGTSFSNVTALFPRLPNGPYYAAYAEGGFLLLTDGYGYLYYPDVAGGTVANVSSGPGDLSGTFASVPFVGPAPSLAVGTTGADVVVGYAHDVRGYSMANGSSWSIFAPASGSVSAVGLVPGATTLHDLWVAVAGPGDQSTLESFENLSDPQPVVTVPGTVTALATVTSDVWIAGTDFDQPSQPDCGCEPVLEELTSSLPTEPVTFAETGLPGGVSWSVNLSTGAELTDIAGSSLNETFAWLPAGSYGFTVTVASTSWQVVNQSGVVTVGDDPVIVPVNFEPARSVAVVETGLVTGTAWSLSVNGTTEVNEAARPASVRPAGVGGPDLFSRTTVPVHYTLFSRTTRSTVTLPVGNFTFNYTSSHGSALDHDVPFEVNASGSLPQVTAPFTRVQYPVGFDESGLATGVAWALNSSSWNATATASTVTVFLSNGTYPVSVLEPTGYSARGPGSIVVSGSALNSSVQFVPAGHPNRALRFVESGLPVGASWTVTVAGTALTSDLTSLAFLEPSGTYAYSVAPVAGYSAHPSDSVRVKDHAVTVHVKFAPVKFPVTFSETGLGPHASWSVRLGAHTYRIPAAGRTIDFANGSYVFVVSGPRGFAAVGSRQVVLQGAGATVEVAFVSDRTPPALPSSEHPLPTRPAFAAASGMPIAVPALLRGPRRRRTSVDRAMPAPDAP